MRKKEYIEKAKNTILNRVKFHAPIVFDDNINYKVLSSYGVDIKKPIFKFEKTMNLPLLKAFQLALQETDFNLVVSSKSLGKFTSKFSKKIPSAVVYDPENTRNAFLQTVNKLNINYFASGNYNQKFQERFFKINGEILNPSFEDFSLRYVGQMNEVFVDFKEFVLNGYNFLCTIKNKSVYQKRTEIELNIPLPKGYFYFKQLPKAILIENLLTKEKFFLNYTCKNAKFSFSSVDGLENSTFCCVNAKVSFCLKPNEQTFVFFNFGENKFALRNLNEIEKWSNLSHQKSCEIFNLQIKTKNPKFDYFFNKTLPQKIWINWLNGQQNSDLEQKYLIYKRLFVKGTLQNYSYKNITESSFLFEKDVKEKDCGVSFVNFKQIGLKEIGIFNGEYYKKIFIVNGEQKFLRVGKTYFYNINGITEHSLKSKEPISLCFGQ